MTGGYRRPGTRGFRTANSGAREGLRQKMEYWRNRDYKTEFGIAVSQAINLALEDYAMGGRDDSGVTLKEKTYFYFRFILECRFDDQFRDTFQKYFESVEEKQARAEEKGQDAVADAESDVGGE